MRPPSGSWRGWLLQLLAVVLSVTLLASSAQVSGEAGQVGQGAGAGAGSVDHWAAVVPTAAATTQVPVPSSAPSPSRGPDGAVSPSVDTNLVTLTNSASNQDVRVSAVHGEQLPVNESRSLEHTTTTTPTPALNHTDGHGDTDSPADVFRGSTPTPTSPAPSNHRNVDGEYHYTHSHGANSARDSNGRAKTNRGPANNGNPEPGHGHIGTRPSAVDGLNSERDTGPTGNNGSRYPNPYPYPYPYDYNEALHLSLVFYEAQRSGRLPASNRVPWRGDSALGDRGQAGEDLTGGYYDAGDFVKFSFTMAGTTTLLAWGLLSYREAYEDAGEWGHALDAVRWAADYFIKCHVAPDVLYGQVGDFSLDHHFWGRPEELNMTRPTYKIDKDHPGSDLAGETAAALAAVSLATQDSDPEYSATCLQHARELYRFANLHRGLYHEAIKGAAQFYESTGYGDELCWAAAWMYRATREVQYLDEAEHHYMQFRLQERPNEFFYNKKVAGAQVLLAQLTRQQDYLDAARSFCDFSALHQKKTPKGLVYIEKAGTLCHAANIAFVCLQAADAGINPEVYRDFARRQIHYMLGDAGQSFVVGFGRRWPMQPHHAASSCPDRPAPCGWPDFSRRAPNPQALWGALVSGPDENDYYEDVREEYIYNEVTLDYNAGFQSAVAGLRFLQLQESAPAGPGERRRGRRRGRASRSRTRRSRKPVSAQHQQLLQP